VLPNGPFFESLKFFLKLICGAPLARTAIVNAMARKSSREAQENRHEAGRVESRQIAASMHLDLALKSVVSLDWKWEANGDTSRRMVIMHINRYWVISGQGLFPVTI